MDGAWTWNLEKNWFLVFAKNRTQSTADFTHRESVLNCLNDEAHEVCIAFGGIDEALRVQFQNPRGTFGPPGLESFYLGLF